MFYIKYRKRNFPIFSSVDLLKLFYKLYDCICEKLSSFNIGFDVKFDNQNFKM